MDPKNGLCQWLASWQFQATNQFVGKMISFFLCSVADTNSQAIYINILGNFPILSYHGNQHIFVAYIYDANATFIQSMKNGEKDHMVNAFKDVY